MSQHQLMESAERVAYLKLIYRLVRAVHYEWGCDWIKDSPCPFCQPGHMYEKPMNLCDKIDRWAETDYDERQIIERAAEEMEGMVDPK